MCYTVIVIRVFICGEERESQYNYVELIITHVYIIYMCTKYIHVHVLRIKSVLD